MGAGGSVLTTKELVQIESATNFTQKEIKRIHKRFRRLDDNGNGELSLAEFQAMPELAPNPMTDQIIRIFDVDKNNQIDFKEFITALSVFSMTEQRTEKLRFAFRVLDVNGNGHVAHEELFTFFRSMLGDSLGDSQLTAIVDTVMAEADSDKDGVLSFDEFSALVSNSDLDSKLSLPF